MLELADIEPYLRDRGLISARAVVDSGFRVADRSRANRVFVVTAEAQRCLVVKAARNPRSLDVAREAAVLERLWALDTGGRLSRFLPKVVCYDRAEGALILETELGRDLREHHARGRFSRGLAALAGRALAALHDLGPSTADELPGRVELARPPRPHEPDLESLRSMSSAAIELTRAIQASERLCAALDEIYESWASESAVHGDIRWDNCLVMRTAGSGRWSRLLLLDWQLAGPGDPGLDVGAFLGEYLHAWLQSIPIVSTRDPGRLLSHSGVPLTRIGPAVGDFWDAYTSCRQHGTVHPAEMLPRAMRFAAVRLLGAALEEAQTLAELRPRVLLLVPLSENVLTRPDAASARLLGLGEPSGVQ